MSQSITLYVDGACRGNPGLGGWGAYIITAQNEYKICGGEENTTNNRMELTAAIEGIKACPPDAKLTIWTDSNYVKQGITEWIHGWKKKAWKNVKNPDLWKQLDATCQGRQIEWHWIKGHAGHAGNEMADQLANQGADETAQKLKTQTNNTINKKKVERDWLLDDPFGFDFAESEVESDEAFLDSEEPFIEEDQIESEQPSQASSTPSHSIENESEVEVDTTNHTIKSPLTETALTAHPNIVITPATRELHGPRQLILDTETTGFYYQESDRIVEVGAIEMINRKLTGSSIHIYINPEKPVGESERIHGISDDFLKDKPKYAEIAAVLFEYLKGAEIIAHNASFDMNFLNMEFERAGFGALSKVCQVTDTLAMAKNKHPGQKNSLDALVRRYEIPERDRTFHGALLDAEILADVYLAMTGGQVAFDMDALSNSERTAQNNLRQKINIDLPVIYPSEQELIAHETWVNQYHEKNGEPCLFGKSQQE